MGCGGQANTRNIDETITVHGDIFNADTRSVLSILKIGKCKFTHKSNSKNTLDNAVQESIKSNSLENLVDYTPMIEMNGKKIIGNAFEVIIYCCL